MTTNSSESGSATETNNPKKDNLMDSHYIKNLLGESVSDVSLSNIRLLLGIIIIAIALVAQFYPKKFPHNRDFLVGCILFFFNGLLQLIIYTKEKNAILFTYPLAADDLFLGKTVWLDVFDVAREVAERTMKEENSLVRSTS